MLGDRFTLRRQHFNLPQLAAIFSVCLLLGILLPPSGSKPYFRGDQLQGGGQTNGSQITIAPPRSLDYKAIKSI